MPLRNSTIISFRHGQEELSKQFIDQLYHGLSGEIEANLGRGVGPVFLDQERMAAGDLFNEEISRELCASATMVMVYTPSYFDLGKPYCAREYKAMLQLETARLQALNQPDQKTHGLIIPVLFRGEIHLPPEIRDNRLHYDFQSFLLSHRKLSKHSKYAPMLRELGAYIAERYYALSALGPGAFDCDNFALPTMDSIREWIQAIVPAAAPPLPGRAK